MRWYVCGLLFFATTINYIDRQVLGLLKPTLANDLGWNEADYGWIVFAFQAAYAAMMPIAGRLIDWMGTRLGYALAVLVWSVAAMGHSLAGSATQFGIARFVLGFGEAANFPAAIRTTADWFPQKERALATGIFNSGSNIGALIAPIMVPFLAANYGWRSAFIVTGALGLVWIVIWLAMMQKPAAQSADRPAAIPFLKLAATPQAWAFLIGKFLTDPVWWFYLYWLPGFLNKSYKLDLVELGPPLITVYLMADIGSIGGGWLSSHLLTRGWEVSRARKTAMLVCALCVTAVVFVPYSGGNLWLAVGLISLATAAHQGWSANLFTMASDLFPEHAVGSVVGFGGFGGAVGGMLVAPAVGYWLDFSHGAYGPLFVVAGAMYLIALAIIHYISPRFEKAAV
ncbi:MAG: MFS transporter [Bryobacteraceae bacterium]